MQHFDNIPSFNEYQRQLGERAIQRRISFALTLILAVLATSLIGLAVLAGLGVWQAATNQQSPQPTPQLRTWCMQGGLRVLEPGDVCRGYTIVANW